MDYQYSQHSTVKELKKKSKLVYCTVCISFELAYSFPKFLSVFVFYFHFILSENILNIISNLSNLSWFVLLPSIWSVLENVPCVLENNPVIIGWSIL